MNAGSFAAMFSDVTESSRQGCRELQAASSPGSPSGALEDSHITAMVNLDPSLLKGDFAIFAGGG